MKKEILIGMIAAMMLVMSFAVSAAAPNWDITGTWALTFTCTSGCSGSYPHTMSIDVFSETTGVFSGTGHNSHTWVVTGTVDGDNINFNIDYDGSSYEVNVLGVIAADGLSMSGTATGPGQAFSFTGVGTATIIRRAEITSPGEGELVSGFVSFDATLYDDDTDDSVQWAVREGTCAAGVGTVFGNVDGFSNSYTWINNVFNAVADTSTWVLGDYCFIFNPTEGAGEANIRLTREFVLVDKAPLVTIENPINGEIVSGVVDIYGTIVEDRELSHYNIAIYPGDADFMDFSKRLEQLTVYQSSGFVDQSIYQWDTTAYPNGEYLIRLAARDKAGNRDLSGSPYLGGDDSQHVITVIVEHTKADILQSNGVPGKGIANAPGLQKAPPNDNFAKGTKNKK